MKKILFWIALILFGFHCSYVAIHANWGIVQLFGILFSVIGMFVVIFGVLPKNKE